MEQNNQLQSFGLPPEQVSDAIVKAMFNKEIVRRDYQKILQGLSNLHFSKDNLQPFYPEFKASDKLLKELDEVRKELGKPSSELLDRLMRIFREVTEPISTLTASKKAELKAANELAAAELRQSQAEKMRVDGIKKKIGDFINEVTRDIGFADDDTKIVSIQKRVGTEKSRTTYYAEFLPELKEKCDALTPVINERKEFIRKANDLRNQQEQALIDNDPVKAAQTKGELEYVEAALTENTIRLQEQAFEQASSIETIVPETMINVAKAKTRRWLWKVDDINLVYKKMPHLVTLEPNRQAIDTILATKRADGSLKGKEEEKMNGITFYLEKYY